MSGPAVCAVVVTHDRSALLRECLDAVLAQTRAPERVVVCDNASTDDTPDVLASYGDAVSVVRLAHNEGGAGGFHEGMAAALRGDAEWLWLMDDDTIPEPTALERLLAAPARAEGLPDPVVLASRVVWTDGRPHPMNAPWPAARRTAPFLAAVERGLLLIRASTFPSMLVRRDAVERHGLPRKGFFIWADDLEFTMRVLRSEAGYLVPDSVAVHKTAAAHQPWDGGPRFYYAVRNGLFLLRGDVLDRREKLGWAFMVAGQTGRYLRAERWRPAALATVARGVRDGLLEPLP